MRFRQAEEVGLALLSLLQVKLGSWTNLFLNTQGAKVVKKVRGGGDKDGAGQGRAGRISEGIRGGWDGRRMKEVGVRRTRFDHRRQVCVKPKSARRSSTKSKGGCCLLTKALQTRNKTPNLVCIIEFHLHSHVQEVFHLVHLLPYPCLSPASCPSTPPDRRCTLPSSLSLSSFSFDYHIALLAMVPKTKIGSFCSTRTVKRTKEARGRCQVGAKGSLGKRRRGSGKGGGEKVGRKDEGGITGPLKFHPVSCSPSKKDGMRVAAASLPLVSFPLLLLCIPHLASALSWRISSKSRESLRKQVSEGEREIEREGQGDGERRSVTSVAMRDEVSSAPARSATGVCRDPWRSASRPRTGGGGSATQRAAEDAQDGLLSPCRRACRFHRER
eukprot:766245-Hanusia_phi.AAC.4